VTAGGSAGSLALSLGANDPGYHNIASGASEEVLLDLQLTAGSEAVEISEISFTMSGSGDESVDVDSVRLIEDVNGDGRFNPLDYDRQIGSTLTGLDDDGDLAFTGLSEIISQGGSEDWLVLYDFDGAQTVNGETYQVHVSGNAAVVDTGVTSGEAITNTGAPLSGGIGTISATGSLSITAGPGNPQSKYISSAEQNLVMMQVALSASATEAIDITSAAFTASGTANESTDLDSARLYVDVNSNGLLDVGIDRQLGSTLTSFTDNGSLTFGSLTEQVAAGGSALWLVVYDLAGSGSADESFRSYVAQGSDITATGVTSSNTIVSSGAPVQGNAMTISSTGALTIALGDNNPGDENISGGAQNVTMAQLRLSASAVEDIEINSIAITTTGSGIRNDEVVSPDMRIYKDVNNNGVYESSIDELITTQNYVGNAWNFPGNTTLTFSSRYIYAGTTENWLIVNNYVNGDVNDNLALSIVNNSDVTATGVSSAAAVNVSGATLNAGVKTVTAGTIPGTLSLAVGGSDPGYRNIPSGSSNEVMFQLLLSAGSNEAIDISKVTLSTSGSGDESTDVDSVRLYNDVDGNGILNLLMDNQIGVTISSLSDDGDLEFSNLNQTLGAGSSANWIVVYDFNAVQTSNGETYQLSLPSNGSVVDTGATSGLPISNSGAPLQSGIATISSVGALSAVNGDNNPVARTISASEQSLSMYQMKLSANLAENIEITSVTFNQSGTADESTDIDSVKLFLDANNNGVFDPAYDTQIGSTISSFGTDSLVTFDGYTETVSAGDSEHWLVVYYLNGNATSGETFRVSISQANQISATGASSSQGILASGPPIGGNSMTVSADGSIIMALGTTNPGTENINGSSKTITMMALSLTTNNVEDVTISSIQLTPGSSGFRLDEIDAPDVSIYEDVNLNGSYDAATDRFITSGNYSGNAWNAPGNITLGISDETIAANSTVQWLILHSFTNGDVNDWIEISMVENSHLSATGVVSGNPTNVSGASLAGGRKTVVSGTTPGTLTISAGADNPAYRYISRGAQDEVMIQLQMAASPVEDIRISSLLFETSGSGNESTDIDSVRLFVDNNNNGVLDILSDTKVGTTLISLTDNGSFSFSGLSEVITGGTSENWIVVYNYDLAENALLETFQVTLPGTDAVADTGETSGQAITPAGPPIQGGEAVISETGTLILSAGAANPGNTNIAGDESNLAAIQVALTVGPNEDITISSARFSVSGTFDDANDFVSGSIQLYLDDNGNGQLDGGDTQLGTDQSWSGNNGMVTFSGLDQTITQNTSQSWIVVCDLNGTASTGENFRVTLGSDTDVSATGDVTSNSVFATGAPVSGGLFSISTTGSMTLALGTNNPAGSLESASATNLVMQQLALSASSVENIAVSSITFTADGTADDVTDLTGVSLYRDLDNNGQLDGTDTQIDVQQTYAANNGTVTFNTTGETVNAGSTVNWLVVYDLNGSGSEGETFRVGIYTAANITLVGVTSAQSISAGGTPSVGNYKTISSTGSMTVAVGDNNPASAYVDNENLANIEMLQFRLTTSSVEAVDIIDVTVTHQGSGDPSTDVLGTALYRDENNDGIVDGGDTQLATASFSGSTVTFNLTGVSISASSTEYWLVAYNFAAGISTGSGFIASLQVATDIDASGATSSNTIIPTGTLPVSGGTQTMTAYSNMTISHSDLSASPVPGATDVGLMQINLSVDKNTSTISSIQVDNRAVTGTSDALDVDLIKIYLENGTSVGFQPGQDQLLGSSSVSGSSGGSGTVSLGSGLDVVFGSPEIIYVVYDISVTADPTNSIGVLINSTGYLSVESPETNLNPANFPISSGQDYSLPVELVSFVASSDPGIILVEWVTASEVNNQGFEVQRRIHKGKYGYETISSYASNPDLEGQLSSANEKQYVFADTQVEKDSTYEYQLVQVDLDGSRHYSSISVVATALEKLPMEFALKQNYPNPFNPQTTIEFHLPVDARVTIEVYDILGKKVVNLVDEQNYKAGRWEVIWDGKNNHHNRIASGIYFYRIAAKEYSKIMKMMMVK